jgi:hypothetical protein
MWYNKNGNTAKAATLLVLGHSPARARLGSSLDEDISVENILFGKPSGESASLFKRWPESRS